MNTSAQLQKSHLVQSLTSANASASTWLEANNYSHLKDGDGQMWQVLMELKPLPLPLAVKEVHWDIKIRLKAVVRVQDLVNTCVLDPNEDARMIALLGDSYIPLFMKPLHFRCPNEEKLKEELIDRLPAFKKQLSETHIATIKKDLVGRWLDKQCLFRQRI